MAGINAVDGTVIEGWPSCQQSIAFIAKTEIGSLVLGRAFGSKTPALQDAPMTPPVIMAHFMAIAEALRKW
jgi:uncharacterized protein